MPRPRAEQITGLTDALLAMTWENENAARMWLRRRGTTALVLGCVLEPHASGGVCLRTEAQAGLPVRADAGAVVDDGVALVSTSHPRSEGADDAFEDWAGHVDAALQAANEDPETDEALRGFFDRGLEAQAAVDAIIAARAAALGTEAVTPASVVAATVEATREAVHKDSAPVVVNPAAFFVIETAEMPEPAARMWAGQIAKKMGIPCQVRDVRTEAVVAEFMPKAPAKPAAVAAAPARKGPGRGKVDHWPVVCPLLERPQGASVDELKRALGWQTAPGKWFIERWAIAADRGTDLVDLGQVDGERRFRLRAGGRR